MTSYNGFISIEEVTQYYNKNYIKATTTLNRVQLKVWLVYAEGRNKANHKILNFSDYVDMMSIQDYIKKIENNKIDYSDIGTKKKIVNYPRLKS